MTPEQHKMARHAIGSPQEAAWNDLVKRGMAERGREGLALVGFHLTEAGARSVLKSDEQLCREDFPSPQETASD